MKRVAVVIIFSLLCFTLSAQSGYILVAKGKVVDGDFFKSKVYMLKDFTTATVKFSNGEVSEAKLNIHTLSQTLRFIDPKGDTLSALNEKLIESVSSGRLMFFKVNNQYVQVVNTDGETSLVLARVLNLGSEKIEGAFGGTNNVSSIQKTTVFNYDNNIERVVSEAKLFYEYRENFYLVNRGKLFIFNKRNLQKFYPKLKDFVEEYYTNHDVRQDNKEEIISLYSQILNNNR